MLLERTPETTKKYLLENYGKKSVDQMAEELEYTTATVHRKLKDLGFERKQRQTKKMIIQDAVMKHYKTKTQAEIARIAGCKGSSVHMAAKKMGIELIIKGVEPRERPKVLEGYFDWRAYENGVL